MLRIGNILRKNADDYQSQQVDRALLTESAEQSLADAVEALSSEALAPDLKRA